MRAVVQGQIQIFFTSVGNRVHLSFVPIDLRTRVARYTVQDKGSEAPLEEDGAPGHQVGDCLALLLSGMPGKSTPQLADLLHCYWVPSTK